MRKNPKIKFADNGNHLEKSGGRYCDLENKECKRGRVYSDDGGYICAYCGGRISKWTHLLMLFL